MGVARAIQRAGVVAALAVLASGCASAPDASSPSETASATPSASPSPSPSPSPIPSPVPLAELSVAAVPWAAGFDHPVYVTSRALDYRVYVVEQPGRVLALSANGSTRRAALDITSRVTYGGERGLLGIAFDPVYPWRMFVNYTGAGGTTVVEEYNFPLDSWQADPEPVRTILTQAQPYANHNGGQLAFGPDGMLYVGLGDGGSGGDPQGHGQNPATFLGAILRVDIRTPNGYMIPEDNPFADGAGGAPEVWAYGLRNPWRFSFDGDLLYIADVGQNRIEEVNVIDATTTAGANFGWKVMEGATCYPGGAACSGADRGFVDPVYAYDHGGGRCSVTGGYVYRGTAYPGLYGTYLFADFCTGEVFGLRVEDGTVTESRNFGALVGRVSSFGTDADGTVYVIDLSSGSISRIVTP